MDQRSYDYWRKVYADFRSSGFTVEKYCRHKRLNPRWFDNQRREAEFYEQHSKHKASPLPESNPAQIPSSAESLFVELIPEQMPVPDVPVLRLSYREANFELPAGFSPDVFRQALTVVLEVL
ncbi:MAG: IS66 family insertion sequence element accessory protein TnpA [Victivallaceae bacterium]